VIVVLVVVMLLPVLGFMYMDMWKATEQALIETRKLKQLRLQILQEFYGKND